MEAAALATEELFVIMLKSLELLRGLTELSKEKETFLTVGDIESLRAATEKEEELIAAMALTEKNRKVKADALSQAIGLFDKDVKFRDIIENIGDPLLQKRLTEIQNKLTESVNTLSMQNEKLNELLQMQVNYTDYMLHLLYTPKSRNHTYNVQGARKDDAADLSMLDLHI